MCMFYERIVLVLLLHIMLGLIGSFSNTIERAWGTPDDKNCQFKCRNGQHPEPNPHYVATSNGCGVPGTQMPKLPDYIPRDKLEECCAGHDICYGTCNVDKNSCDREFENCLRSICSDFESVHSPATIVNGCKFIAKAMYTAVAVMGCKHYLAAQKEACICREERINYDL